VSLVVHMIRCRAMYCCLLALLTLPPACSAQSANSQDHSPSTISYTVSARELSIPEKARKAFFKGNRRLALRDWVGSLSEFQRAIAAFPGYYEAYDEMGNAELDLSHGANAEAAFRKAIDLSAGRYAPPHSGLGLALCMEKRFDEAETSARTGVELDSSYAAGHFALAWILYVTGRQPEAREQARQAAAEKPDFAEAFLLLAQIEMQEHDSAAIVEDLDAFLKLVPSGPATAKVVAIRDEAQRALSDKSSVVVAKAEP
jgi:tetratricopeptide (TPR) repeat protein